MWASRDDDGGDMVMIGGNELVWEGGYIDFCLWNLGVLTTPSTESVFGRDSLRVAWWSIDTLKPGFGWILVILGGESVSRWWLAFLEWMKS